MTAPRPEIAADLAKHLSAQIEGTIVRHARLAAAGGVSTGEWSAAMMLVVEAVAVQAMAAVMIGADHARRPALFDVTVEKLRLQIDARRRQVLLAAEITDKVIGR